MSIKSLFENIADAIKDKNPNITNVTPVEMPSAIRSIPSGSSTAGGVTYDNTASGLTANNVQDAIDELAEDVSTINSDLSEKVVSFPNFSVKDTISLTADDAWTATRNGWLYGSIPSALGYDRIISVDGERVWFHNNADQASATYVSFFIPVKSGQVIVCNATISAIFYGML